MEKKALRAPLVAVVSTRSIDFWILRVWCFESGWRPVSGLSRGVRWRAFWRAGRRPVASALELSIVPESDVLETYRSCESILETQIACPFVRG